MAAFTLAGIAGAIGAAATAAGTVMSFAGQNKADKASKRAEKLRENQMNIESQRSRRQIIRQALVARSDALSNATAQGAAQGSGLAGGIAQIGGDAGRNITDVNQNQALGTSMFAANRQIAAGQTMASTGNGISSLGGTLIKNQDAIGRLGTYATS